MSNTHERRPWEQFLILQRELGSYSPHLLEKKVIVVGNKCDLKGSFLNYEEFKSRTNNDLSEGLEHLVLE